MFYESEIKSFIRVPPNLFSGDTKEAISKRLNEQFEGYISKDLGVVIFVSEIINIGEGVIIAGDGAAYYETTFKVFTFKPEVNEVVIGKITDIADFGAFIEVGPLDGMIHISQTMDDFVSFSKSNVLTGRDSKKVLRVNDICRARIIAVSYKEVTNPKIGLTMRQSYLGNINWIDQELKKEKPKKIEKEKWEKHVKKF